MAALPCVFAPGAVALTAAAARTVLQITAPANQRLHLAQVLVSFDGSAAGAPAIIRVLKQTTAGTMTGGLAVLAGPGSETPQATVARTATAEPTASDIYKQASCQVLGNILLTLNLVVPGGTRVGIEVTSPVSCNCYPVLEWVE